MIDKLSPVPFYIQLRDGIKRNVIEGVWKVGEQIPTENELMEKYEVSRATVRNAISSLVNEGFLVKQRGRGTFVARQQPSMAFEPLISFAYNVESMGASSESQVVENSIIVPDEELLRLLRWKEPKECLYVKRVRHGDGIPLAIEESFFNDSTAKFLKLKDLSGSISRLLLEELRISISRVEQIVAARKATAEEKKLLNLDKAPQVLEMERWIILEDEEEPFYYLRFIMRGDLYSLTPVPR
ncbi:MAG TPA: GntR family transcriptional regulator [Bacillota bacterium]|jgi:GntR family transcriptional regulator|nr:GntR family transcriptional regulator [Bacillota bacterium]